MRNFSGFLRRGLPAFALIACVLLGVAGNLRLHGARPAYGDTPAYLLPAWNLLHHGVLTTSLGDPPLPLVGREPGYPLLLAGLMRLGTPLAGFSPDCLAADQACPAAIYRPGQLANLVLTMLAALLVGWTAWRLTGWRWAGVLGTGYIALNMQMLGWRHYLVSDFLALALTAGLVALLVAWAQRPAPWRAVAAGLAWGALVLVKAVFLWLLPFAALGWVWRRLRRAPLPAFAPLLLGAAILLPALWVLRNGLLTGSFVLTDVRSGIALSTREVFNHMGLVENLCAFVFWIHGSGDDLARLLFPPAVWQPFQLDWPGGYYDLGQNRYLPWVERLVAEGLSPGAAQAAVDRELLGAFLAHPVGYLASMPALIWRGIWIDGFGLLGVPALVAALGWAWRRGEAAWLVALLPGLFNLLFYPAVSLNVTRYQITAIPATALGTVWLAWQLAPRARTWLARCLARRRMAVQAG